MLYIGQAIGSAIGGNLFERNLLTGTGYVAMALVFLALLAILISRPVKSVAVPV